MFPVNAVDVHGNVGPNSNELVLPSVAGVGDVADGPRDLTVPPNFPNPFRGATALRLGMPRPGQVKIELYSASGRRVVSHDLGLLPAGWRDVLVEARDDSGRPLANGVYFCRVSAGGEARTRKLVIRR